jgi:hypothetical protein
VFRRAAFELFDKRCCGDCRALHIFCVFACIRSLNFLARLCFPCRVQGQAARVVDIAMAAFKLAWMLLKRRRCGGVVQSCLPELELIASDGRRWR